MVPNEGCLLFDEKSKGCVPLTPVAPADENLLKFKFRSTRYGHRSGHRSPKNQNAYMDLIITIVDSH